MTDPRAIEQYLARGLVFRNRAYCSILGGGESRGRSRSRLRARSRGTGNGQMYRLIAIYGYAVRRLHQFAPDVDTGDMNLLDSFRCL